MKHFIESGWVSEGPSLSKQVETSWFQEPVAGGTKKEKKKTVSKAISAQNKLASFVFVVPVERPSDVQLHRGGGGGRSVLDCSP